MKKLIIILFSFIAPIFNSGCLLEADKEYVTDTLVVQVHDTTRVHDTTKIYKDTLFLHDTLRLTIIKKDTLWRHDTVRTTITKRDTLWRYDTTRIHDTIPKYKDTLFVHDTIRTTITKRDTLWLHDTLRIHDTTKVTVTVTVHDTLRTFATNTNSSLLVGTWDGIVAGQNVRLAVSTEVYPYTNYAFSFTANVGTKAYNGYIKSTSGNNATVEINGTGVYGEDANWIFSITNNIITLQQTGYQMFPTPQSFTLSRMN